MWTIRTTWVAVPIGLLATVSLPAQEKKSLTLEQAVGGSPRVQYYAGPQRARWTPDGRRYVWRKDGKTVWVNPDNGEETSPESSGEGGDEMPARFRRMAEERRAGSDLTELLGKGTERRIATFSADRSRASFVGADNNLRVVNVSDKAEWQVTEDGDENHFNGILDWVYQEEIYGRGDFRAHWWSGDGTKIAFLRLDETDVKTFTVVDHVPPGSLDTELAVAPEVSKYPKAGDPNPSVRLAVAWPGTRKVVDVDLGAYDPDILVVRVGWTPDHEKVLFAVQDRIQTWMELNVADPATGAVQRLIREESDTWVNRLPFPRYLEDGSFLWLSERTGYQHIYHYVDGEPHAVTSGEWQVRGIEKLGTVDGVEHIWFTATKDGAIDNNLYRVPMAGGEVTRLTYGDGYHSVSLNHDGSWFLDYTSTVDTPAQMRLCQGNGKGFKILDQATSKDEETYVFRPTRRMTIQARDGYPLDATLIRPPNFDPNLKYPIYLATYSGPDAPSVRNTFRASSWHQFLAQRGAMVLQVNVRSASGRGQAHTGECYKQLGVRELQDLEDAVAHVCEEFSGDPARVAIDGWSYGGFMAAYALTHSDKFAVGIAGAGVHDWRLYDTVYTERYMSTPQRNPEGYDATSVIKAADKLHGHLVILHGGRDDNVHLQNTMQLVYALQQAGVDDFEMMVYPRSRHGVRGSHHRRLIWRALQEHLGLTEI